MDGVLYKVTHKLNSKERKNALYQIITGLNIIKKHGYDHGDVHSGNIMYKISVKQKYQWYIIDYGMVRHPSFIKNWHDKNEGGGNEILSLINEFIVDKMSFIIEKKKLKRGPFENYIKTIKNSEYYIDIKKYIPKQFFNSKKSNKRLLNNAISIVTRLKYHSLNISAMGFDIKKYKKYISKQMNEDILLYMVKHCLDKDYSLILSKIKH